MDAMHTPGPWSVDGEDLAAKVIAQSGWTIATTEHIHGGRTLGDSEEIHLANMRLIASSPDHALLLAAFVSGRVRWEPFQTKSGITGELCFRGMRHCTELDEFGCPKLTDLLRAEMRKVLEQVGVR